MISWLELNHLNAFVKIATDTLSIDAIYKKLEKCSETFYGALV